MDTGRADMGNQQGNRQGRPGKVTGEPKGRQSDRGRDRGGLAKWGKMNKSPLLRPTIPFIHCKIFSLYSGNNEIQRYG